MTTDAPGKDVVPATSLVPLEALPGVLEFAASISKASIVPGAFRGREADIVVAVCWGAELGIGPMQSLQSIDVIDGRASLRAELRLTLVRKAGHHIASGPRANCRHCMGDQAGPKVQAVVDGKATIHAKRRDTGEEDEFTFTKEEAQKANLLGKDNWKKYEADMLWARVLTRCCRRMFSDVLMGLAGDEYENEVIAAAETPAQEQPTVTRPAPKVGAQASDDDDIADAEVVEDPATRSPIAGDGSPAETGPGHDVPQEGEPPGPLPIDADPILNEPIDADQIKHINAAFRDVGIEGREAKHDYIRGIVHKTFESSKDLTHAEAQKVIDTLERTKSWRALHPSQQEWVNAQASGSELPRLADVPDSEDPEHGPAWSQLIELGAAQPIVEPPEDGEEYPEGQEPFDWDK